jgi:hypothetical protein
VSNAPRRPQRPTDAWAAFAYARGLRYVPPTTTLLEGRGRVVEGVEDDVALVLDTCMESSRDRFVAHTRITGKAVAPVEARVAILTKQDRVDPPYGCIEGLGEAVFDERFYVKCDPASVLRKIVDDDVLRAMLRFPQPMLFTYDGELGRMHWEGEERELETLQLAADVILAACRWKRGQAGYR